MFIIWGSRFAFKKNRNAYHGRCQACGQQNILEDFTARKWFTLYFLPIFPISKPQTVMSYCSKCKKGFVLSSEEKAPQPRQSKEEILAQVEEQGENPKVLVRAVYNLQAMGAQEEAKRIAEQLQHNHSDLPEVQLMLARYYAKTGETDRARENYEIFLDKNPEEYSIISELADLYILKRNLWKAEELLVLGGKMIPGVNHQSLVNLSIAYEDEGRSEKAYEMIKALASFSPDYVRQHKEALKRLRRLEKQLNKQRINIPKAPLKISSGKVLAPIILLAIFFFAGVQQMNIYNNQHLHIINPFSEKAQVLIGEKDWLVDPYSRKKVDLPEGEYKAEVLYSNNRFDYEFKLENSFFERFSDNHFYVLNVGGGACLYTEDIIYAISEYGVPEGQYKLDISPFTEFRNIDFPFYTGPSTLQISSGNYKIKKQLTILQLENPASVQSVLLSENYDLLAVLDFSETHIKMNPEDKNILANYNYIIALNNENDRGKRFLENYLNVKPVLIQIHRVYQSLFLDNERKNLISQYDDYISSDPSNSAYHYLRGRFEERYSGFDYYKKAISLDSKNAFAYNAIAYHYYQAGEFSKALNYSRTASQLMPDNSDFQNLNTNCNFALGQFSDIEATIDNLSDRDLPTLNDFNRFIQAKILQNQLSDAEAALIRLKVKYKFLKYENSEEIFNYRNLDYHMYKNDIAKLKSLLIENDIRPAAWYNFVINVNKQDLDAIAVYLSSEEATVYDWIIQWLLLNKSGNTKKANAYLDSITKQLAGPSWSEWLDFAQARHGDPFEFLKHSPMDLFYKRLWALVGAQRYPKYRKAFANLAKIYNVDLTFPYYHVKELAEWF